MKERQDQERRHLDRALQQAAVAALGQFALTMDDFDALLQQAVLLATQTLEVEFCEVLEQLPRGDALLLRTGAGWKKGIAGVATVPVDGPFAVSVTLRTGEPIAIRDWRKEGVAERDPILAEHGVVSGLIVPIVARRQTYGVLGVYSKSEREFDSDDLQFLLSIANTLAAANEQSQAQAELKKLADFTRLNPTPALELRADGSVTYFNEAAANLARSFGLENPGGILDATVIEAVRQCFASGRGTQLEWKLNDHVLSGLLHPLVPNQVVHAYVSDITERLSLEAQLRQSQKLESIGQLAAGVAHDFNNMLTVIQGHAGMLNARSLPPEIRESVQAMSYAAERAAGLTRQLLLFSRKTVLQPRLLDLSDLIVNLLKMLRRLLGEDIELEYEKPGEPPFVEADAGMIEQVLMNLAVNARDAMPSGGQLRIRTDRVTFSGAEPPAHPQARAGDFIRIQAKDAGHGMDADTMARIFEPFFTTKAPGKGTGLGLATVYGIVKQHLGWIEVSSAPGQGTTFDVYLPAPGPEAARRRKRELSSTAVPRGNETVLLVEDEPSVLAMGNIILQDCGYNVFCATSGVEALQLWEEHAARIDLLLTDMIMPRGISGLELAERLVAEKPGLKVLFASGYSVDQFDTDFIRNTTGSFIQKPYTRATLPVAVRERLDGKA